MDIPNTGAIFTLGKSHLAENTQSYFYIKNDPIRRLIAGPYQSAVICESGRLFVWGENHYGQLGIGGHSSHAGNQNNNNNNNNRAAATTNHNNNNNGSQAAAMADIIIKPTCVKSLKTLGLKITDLAFGIEWSVTLTHSNELFYSGRSIFSADCAVASNFTAAIINGESCQLIRKPFRLEEFDDCLANNEEAESFVSVMAGNNHFVVLTSFGRLFGWGSNQSHQLGATETALLEPHEIVLDSAVQQYTCGPESTLVLTQKGGLYLTGRLNEFVFPQFTELQKNLSPSEQIIFMHISHASEIFIITNTGSIYHSFESVRNKSLIFQRFYDYDSEENGPIWKMLKGTSFYAVLTKAYKFYTTFSESGHHLKTFREISKFKNLRLLDLAVGDRHVLVHGIPRTSTLAATMGPGSEHRFMSQSAIMSNTTGGLMNRFNPPKSQAAIMEETQNERPKTNTPVHNHLPVEEEEEEPQSMASEAKDANNNMHQNEAPEHNDNISNGDTAKDSMSSPTESLTSRKSMSSVRKLNHMGSSERSLRPRTPYPESSGGSSPQTVVRKSPMHNPSYEAAMREDSLDQTSPALSQSLENIPEAMAAENGKPDLTVSMPTPPTEEDEQLTVEISETQDPLDHTMTINEIRFINNGIDVTANVKKSNTFGSSESLDASDDHDEHLNVRKQAEEFMDELEEEIDEGLAKAKASKSQAEQALKAKTAVLEETVEDKLKTARDTIESKAKDAEAAVDTKLTEYRESLESAAKATGSQVANMKDDVSKAATAKLASVKEDIEQAANETEQAMDSKMVDAKNAMNNAAKGASNAVNSTLLGARGSMESAAARTTAGAKGAAAAVGESAKKASDEIEQAVDSKMVDAKNAMNSAVKGANNAVESALLGARGSMESAAASTTAGAKGAAAAVGESAKKAANEAEQAADSKMVDAKNAINNAAKGASNAVESTLLGAKESMESAAARAAAGAKGAAAAVGENAKKAAKGVKDTMENVGSSAAKGVKDTMENVGNTAAKATDDARHAIEQMGNSAAKATGDAKDAMGNAMRKMADDTRSAVGAVTSKISHEVMDAKNSLSSLLHGRKNKVDVSAYNSTDEKTEERHEVVGVREASGDLGPPIISVSSSTPGGHQEDDERTTASVNSNLTSSGNPFEGSSDSNNPFENDCPFDEELNAMIQRSKKAYEEDVERASMAAEQAASVSGVHVAEATVEEKSKFTRFMEDVKERTKSLSCRNEKAVKIMDDQPPRYTEADELALQPVTGQPMNGSKVCTIL